MNIAWTIAGSDSCAGAGIAADVKTFADFDIHGCTIISAVTAQNTSEVIAIEAVSEGMFAKQLAALKHEFPPAAIKSGMVANAEQAVALAEFLAQNPHVDYVLDPVMIASSGARLCDDATSLAMIEHCIPRARIITPNIDEAQHLARNYSLEGEALAWQVLRESGAKAVLLKGGHVEGSLACDYYVSASGESFALSLPKIKHTQKVYHGSGCRLSAAITANLTKGHSVQNAIFIAKDHISQLIDASVDIGSEQRLLHRTQEDEFKLATYNVSSEKFNFSPMKHRIAFYPVVDTLDCLEQVIGWGVKTVQLRIKDLAIAEQVIPMATALAREYEVQLFINDHWSLAIEHHAFGVHLGQGDLNHADLAAIVNAGLRLGVSTHDYHELARALVFNPSYIALGPIFKTQTKQMPFAPQGLATIKQWKKLIGEIPLVVIGGLELEHFKDCYRLGADGVAVVNYLKKAKDPQEACALAMAQ